MLRHEDIVMIFSTSSFECTYVQCVCGAELILCCDMEWDWSVC